MGRLSLARSRRGFRVGGVDNVQEQNQRRRKLSQMIKAAIAKSREVSILHAWETCLL